MNNTDSSSTRTSPSLPSSASLSLTSSSSSSSSQIIPSWLAFHRLENEMGDDDGTSSTEDGIDLFGWFGWFLPHAAVVAFFVCITMTWIKLRTICKYMLDSTIGTRRWWWGWRLPFPTGHRRRTRRSNGYDNKNRNDDDRLSIEDRRRILLEDFDSSGHMMRISRRNLIEQTEQCRTNNVMTKEIEITHDKDNKEDEKKKMMCNKSCYSQPHHIEENDFTSTRHDTLLMIPVCTSSNNHTNDDVDEDTGKNDNMTTILVADNRCAICLESYRPNDEVVWSYPHNSTCKHVFHQHCIVNYFSHRIDDGERPCPCCRQPFMDDDW